jgi:adenylate cyclase
VISDDDKLKRPNVTMREMLPEPMEVGRGLGTGPLERRLAAFMALDIANYSAMISRDEATAHKRVGRDLAVVVRHIHKFEGRVLQFSGDGLLAEFSSTVATLKSALHIQSAAASRNRRRSTDQRILYRIGIDAGEIVVQNARVGGDVINIAARLEQIAEGGAICICDMVFAQVKKTVRANYTPIGAIRLKNIRYPVSTYRVSLAAGKTYRTSAVDQARAVPVNRQDYRPSIAILPFRNLSDDTGSDYFSDGVVEDIIVSLSGLRELRVISRASTSGYHGGETDVREVCKTLGVRYVMSGSIRRSRERIRAAVELVDAETGFGIWSDSADFPLGELFEMQDRLVRHIVTHIAPQIEEEELRRAMRRRPESMTAYDLTLQALHLMDYLDKDMFERARDVLRQAMDDDPDFAMPVAWSVWWHIIWVGQGWSTDPIADLAAANELAIRTIRLDPNNALGLAIVAHMHSYLRHDYEGALTFFARALRAGPGSAIVLIRYALTLAYVGRSEEAIHYASEAMSLSPLDHKMYFFQNVLALAHFAGGSYDEAAKWARASDLASPRFTANVRTLIASLAAAGADAEARDAAVRLMALEPHFRLSQYERTLLPYRPPHIRARFMAGLRSAGLPE